MVEWLRYIAANAPDRWCSERPQSKTNSLMSLFLAIIDLSNSDQQESLWLS